MFPAVAARYESCITLCVQLELSTVTPSIVQDAEHMSVPGAAQDSIVLF